MLFLWTSCPTEQGHSVLSEGLAEGQSSKVCCARGYTWLLTSHQWYPQGSAVGPLPFKEWTGNINDQDAGVECTPGKFADDTELGCAADSL